MDAGYRGGTTQRGLAEHPVRPVVTAPEEIDITNAAGLRAALLEAAADRSRALVVDMAQTQICDSAGLNVLVRAHKRARAEGGELLLVICAAAVLRISPARRRPPRAAGWGWWSV
jgi:anti-anti-sigma factor